jgi:hypothetical protein
MVNRPACHRIRHPSGTRYQFFLLSLIMLDNYGFVDVECPLWREVGSLAFNCCWASLARSSSGLNPTGLVSLFLCSCGVLSLTRGRVSSFQLLLGIASAVFLGSESHRTRKLILLSPYLRLFQPGRPGSSIHFPQKYTPDHWVCITNLQIIAWYTYTSYMYDT